MTEENKGIFTTNLLIGLAIGAFLTYLLLKKDQQTASLSLQKTDQLMNWKPLDEISTIDRLEQPIHHSYAQVPEQQNMYQTPVPEQQNMYQAPVHEQQNMYQAPVHEQQNISTHDGSSKAYKNSEKWEITRNEDGFIEKLSVSRDAKINADK